jgi:hypothetical protein
MKTDTKWYYPLGQISHNQTVNISADDIAERSHKR